MTEDSLLPTDNVPQELDPSIDYYQALVGENKKFKDNQALARGKFESDNYIKILERRQDEFREENLRLREESNTRAQLQELIDQYKNQQLTSSTPPSAKEEIIQPKIDPKQIESLVSSKIQEHESIKTQQQNFDLVRDKLQQKYGDNYTEVVKKQIADLGMTESDLNDMAKTKPKALIKALGLDQAPQQDQFSPPPRSEQRRDNFAPSGKQKRTWAYYQELKKSNPKLYYDKSTAIQMHNDALELGEAFHDGDYWRKGLHEQ